MAQLVQRPPGAHAKQFGGPPVRQPGPSAGRVQAEAGDRAGRPAAAQEDRSAGPAGQQAGEQLGRPGLPEHPLDHRVRSRSGRSRRPNSRSSWPRVGAGCGRLARGAAPRHQSDRWRASRGGATSRPRPAGWPAPGSRSPAPPWRAGRQTSRSPSGRTARQRGRRAELGDQAGQRGAVDPPGGASQVVVVQEGVDGVLERNRATGESNNLPHEGPSPWCRSKRGQLEPPMPPRQPRSVRQRRAIAASKSAICCDNARGRGLRDTR
jgi:hypothetical protein